MTDKTETTPTGKPLRLWRVEPKWCGYPSPLVPGLGCWSLLAGYVANEDYCRDCECRVKGGSANA